MWGTVGAQQVLVCCPLLPFGTVINTEMGGWDFGHIKIVIIPTFGQNLFSVQAVYQAILLTAQKRENYPHVLDGKSNTQQVKVACTAQQTEFATKQAG